MPLLPSVPARADVGKTTLAVNLGVALAKMGHKVGLLDADVYGPNVPLMLGVNAQTRGWSAKTASSRWRLLG